MIKVYTATCEGHNGLKGKYVVIYDNSTKRIYSVEKICKKHLDFMHNAIVTRIEKNGAVYDKYEQPTTEEPTATEEPTTETTPEYKDTDSTTVEIDNYCVGGFVGDAKETLNNIYGMTTSNYDGVAYPEKEDCKTCIYRSDCKYKLTYQFNDTCEMYQPVSLYL